MLGAIGEHWQRLSVNDAKGASRPKSEPKDEGRKER
jgi:hypothetical protein